ncbi:MAG: methyltransferase domain-containing protein [Peptococcaceae bacterium]|nr:methyltransferase domain-containing protein [Peptococcaceae bacterium]
MIPYPHLLCPICGDTLTTTDKNAFCPQNHNFDRARQGYLNLQLSPVKTQYTKILYRARQHLFCNGVFDPLVSGLSNLIACQHTPSQSVSRPAHTHSTNPRNPHPRAATVLDAGCGDGSLLAALIQKIFDLHPVPNRTDPPQTVLGLGIDICKDAIKIAAQTHPTLTWCVADLARPPIADNTQDIIFNILAPANYAEFRRLLAPGGVLIKVMPGPDHFKEIRQALCPLEETQDSVPNTLRQQIPLQFSVSETRRLTYDVPAAENIEHFIHMSPLSWHTLPEKKEAALNGRLQKIRLDYILMSLKESYIPEC